MTAQLFGDCLYFPSRYTLYIHLRQRANQCFLGSLIPLEDLGSKPTLPILAHEARISRLASLEFGRSIQSDTRLGSPSVHSCRLLAPLPSPLPGSAAVVLSPAGAKSPAAPLSSVSNLASSRYSAFGLSTFPFFPLLTDSERSPKEHHDFVNLHLAHFGGLIWPPPGLMVVGQVFRACPK